MKIVTVTGGNGGYTLLSGLKKYNTDITAIIGAFDSGGSTGRLRREYGGIALGDLRRGFLALGSDQEAYSHIKELTNYRFESGELRGHNLGNLLLFSLGAAEGMENLRKAEKIYGLKENHHVMPPSFDDCHLCAELENGEIVEGETNIDVPKHDSRLKISRVFLKPEARSHEWCNKEIESADAVVIGPGDLYSSILQNILVGGIPESMKKTKAKKIYVCNTMTKKGETKNFRTSDFVKEIEKYMGCCPDYILVNSNTSVKTKPEENHLDFVEYDEKETRKMRTSPVLADVIDESCPSRHDPDKLAKTIMGMIK